jgi:hypothetical protein
LHLSPEEIAAAEACGVSFLPASAAQVQRLAMQRKVFYRAGAPILATLGDGLFETVGTLQQLIEEGRQQQRDLSQWLEAAEPGAAAGPETLLEVTPEAAPKAVPAPEAAKAAPAEPASLPEPVAAELAAPPLKRPRQKRRRPELVAPELAASEPSVPEPAVDEPVAKAVVAAEAAPPQDAEAEVEMGELVVAPPLPPAASRSLGRIAVRVPAGTAETPGQDRGKRWLMAGAARRGRAGKHWSTRQR